MENASKPVWAKRISQLFAFFLVLMLLVIGRLFEKQIIQYDHYIALAKNQQVSMKIQPAARGKILIHDDLEKTGSVTEVALDVKRYNLSIVPKNVIDKEKTAQTISQILKSDKNEIYEKINNDKLYIPPLFKNLDENVIDQITKENITGIIITPVFVRYYPETNLLSQTLGFVNSESQGKYGVEGYYNDELTGYNGKKSVERDPQGRMIDLVSEEPARDGDTLLLSIDRSVQYYIEKVLENALTTYQADSGSVVVVEPKTGRLIAITSKPDFNPNDYNKVAVNDSQLFMNQVIAGAWEPGSIMKPVTMSAAINQGAVTPETTGVYSNMVNIDGYEIHTAEDKAFGLETMTQVLENSDNVAMVDVANKIGNQVLYDYFKNYHFYDLTGIDIFGESVGQVPRLKEWRNITRATVTFGQGITITPIQMVMAYAAIANKGTMMMPRVVDKIIESDGKEKTTESRSVNQVITEDTATKITGMLVSVVENGHGKRAAVPGFKVAGKTGTAQVAKADGSGYDENIHIGSFAGFAPAEDPRFAMMVRLNNPKTVKFAESSAAPVFGQIANYLLNYYYKLPASQ